MRGMLDIYEMLPAGALFVVFVRFAMEEGNLLYLLGISRAINAIKNDDVYEFFYKCVCDCPPCMASVWGTVFYLAWQGNEGYLQQWIVFVCCLSGLLFLLVEVLYKLDIEFDDLFEK